MYRIVMCLLLSVCYSVYSHEITLHSTSWTEQKKMGSSLEGSSPVSNALRNGQPLNAFSLACMGCSVENTIVQADDIKQIIDYCERCKLKKGVCQKYQNHYQYIINYIKAECEKRNIDLSVSK